MSVEALKLAREASRPRLPQILRLAIRDLRGALSSFPVFVACIALGVAAITGVNAVADALRSGFESQGRVLLGGDLALSRIHAPVTAAERGSLAELGSLSEIVTLRAMLRNPVGTDGKRQALVEIKAVDAAYPLIGRMELNSDQKLAEALARRDGVGGVVIAPILLERLGLKPGDRVMLGELPVEIRATIKSEPDRLAGRAAFGPRIIVSIETLLESGLGQTGSLARWHYRLVLPNGENTTAAEIGDLRNRIAPEYADAGFLIEDRREPSPEARRAVDRFSQFLTLVGLTALLVGGVGIANAVSSYLERKRKVIGVFRSLGATSRMVFGILLSEVLLLALLGIGIGLVAGYLIPLIGLTLFGQSLPIALDIRPAPMTMLLASAYGLLVALVFVLWPLGLAERVSPSVLFRPDVSGASERPRWPYWVGSLVAALALTGLAIATSDAKLIALWFCLGLGTMMALFALIGRAIQRLAARSGRPNNPQLRLALSNIGGPGSLAASVALSLGTGLSLLVAVALTDRSLVHELASGLPEKAPSHFFLDIPRTEQANFETVVRTAAGPQADLDLAPMLRGRLVRLNDVRAEDVKAAPGAAWVLRGDRGLTYSTGIPDGSTLVEGDWWAPDYAGEPLVSFEAEIAKGLGLAIGDTVTVNVLGRNLSARIANLRTIKWETLAINFVLVFSPNALAGAPVNMLATLTMPARPDLATEARLEQAVATAYPAITAIRVRDAIETVASILERIMLAIRVAGSITLAAGAIVLAGALATAQRRRIYQAVVLKALGATRARILLAHAIEYSLIAAVTAVFASLIGIVAAWIVTTFIMDVTFVFSLSAVLTAVALALALVLAFGAFGTWRVLSAAPVPYLKNE